MTALRLPLLPCWTTPAPPLWPEAYHWPASGAPSLGTVALLFAFHFFSPMPSDPMQR